MAGDYQTAKQVCRKFCQCGLCVTTQAQNFIYSDGEEAGFVIGLIDYPRFPKYSHSIKATAINLAHQLATECCQKSFLIMDAEKTSWYHKENGSWNDYEEN